ncbi:pyocin activator PrtN family protein [Pseudomonas asiatica]|uniref:pyocin activator PrtN family protein n=1 Tax=Pseudomonas asiatica TaxID=2219225 RepID=UPI001E3CABE6|nr:pyocin activator PrtN family protein [Pseudomonas asiatica]MCE0851833.1 pyocin activator PrtN family protein [Pseudomonas asiatica]
MNTVFILMAQYNGRAIIPIDVVCQDYFDITPTKLKAKVARGEINLPLVWMEESQKGARGVHLTDLASYIDSQRAKAKAEQDKLMGRGLRRVS